MYRIAVVQNQSEMAHYGYADIRPLLGELGYDVELFTANNVGALDGDVLQDFDAVFLGSNSLNDKTIRAAFLGSEVGPALTAFVRAGGGLLSMHQLGMASNAGPQFPFLPDASQQELQGVVRPLTESPVNGKFTVTEGTERHILLRYPHRVESGDLAAAARDFRSLPGLYWHWWEGVNLEAWDVLVEDDSRPSPRALIVATKEAGDTRAVFSALTLDWQRQRTLLENLLRYVVEGRHSTAVLLDPRHSTIGFEYLMRSLESRRFPFRRYALDTSTHELVRYIAEGVHTSLVVAPNISDDQLPADLRSAMESALAEGGLRVLRIEPPSRYRSVGSIELTSRQRYAIGVLQQVELRVQTELRNGYVDGSFWSTAEVLQSLEAMGQARGNYAALVGPTLEGIDRHERNGSYDGVFGATSAACWIRAKYLGATHRKTMATVVWIRDSIGRYESRERVLALTSMLRGGVATAEEQQELRRILGTLELSRLTQSDVVAYLRAAVSVRELGVITGLLTELCARHAEDGWIDLATAAEAASLTQDAVTHLRSNPSGTSQLSDQLRSRVDDLLYGTIIWLQEAFDRGSSRGADYPWDGKASTAVRCLEAWLKFDASLDLPVYEAADVLERAGTRSADLASGRTALAVLEELKEENDALRERAAKSNDLVAAVPGLRLQRGVIGAALAVLVYVIAALAIGVSRDGATDGLLELLDKSFVELAAVHGTLAALVAAYVVLPWSKWLGRDD